MQGKIKIYGDIFSTGCWPSDEEMEASDREIAADLDAEAEALEWIEGTAGDVGRSLGIDDAAWNASMWSQIATTMIETTICDIRRTGHKL